MPDDFRQDQLDEIDALRSVFEESRVVMNSSVDQVSGSISVELEPFRHPCTVYATVDGVRKSSKVAILSPIHFDFSLPSEYPSNASPIFELHSEWMNNDVRNELIAHINELCAENLGMPVLFFCCDALVEMVKKMELILSEISLDDTPFGAKHNLSSLDVMNRMTESSEKSQDYNFENSCFDCEVCYENKAGRECVLFTPCNHVFCRECVKSFFMSRITGLQVRALECLSDGCETPAVQSIIRGAIGEVEFERYERILLERALGQMNDVVICPRPKCQKPVVLSSQTPNLGSCEICGLSFCAICQRAYHGLEECRFKSVDRTTLVNKWNAADTTERIEMSRRFGGMASLQRVIDTIQNEGWIEGNSRPCPKCRVNIEKNHGCNKMHCTKCDASFCWLCNRVLDKNNPYDHFNGDGDAECNNRLFDGADSDDDDDDLWMFDGDSSDNDEGSDSDDG